MDITFLTKWNCPQQQLEKTLVTVADHCQGSSAALGLSDNPAKSNPGKSHLSHWIISSTNLYFPSSCAMSTKLFAAIALAYRWRVTQILQQAESLFQDWSDLLKSTVWIVFHLLPLASNAGYDNPIALLCRLNLHSTNCLYAVRLNLSLLTCSLYTNK